MKTLLASFLALGVLSTAASAQYCPPGYGARVSSIAQTYRPSHAMPRAVIEAVPEMPRPAPEAPAAPIEPAPLPAPEEAPPK